MTRNASSGRGGWPSAKEFLPAAQAAAASPAHCAWPRSCKKGDLIVAFLPDTGSRYLSKIYNDGWMREHGYADSEVTLTAADVIRVKHQNGKTREPIIVGPNQTVFHALKTMQQQDISQLPVFEGDQSIGTVFEDQILNLALQGKDLRKLIVREVMGAAMPQVPFNAPVERLTYILTHDSPAVFIEMDRQARNRYEVRFDGHHRGPGGAGLALIFRKARSSYAKEATSWRALPREQPVRLASAACAAVADGFASVPRFPANSSA